MWDAASQVGKFAGKIAGKYKMRIIVERPDRRKRDLDNVIKALSDVLVSAKIIADDHYCIEFSMAWGDFGKMCHVEITGVEDA